MFWPSQDPLSAESASKVRTQLLRCPTFTPSSQDAIMLTLSKLFLSSTRCPSRQSPLNLVLHNEEAGHYFCFNTCSIYQSSHSVVLSMIFLSRLTSFKHFKCIIIKHVSNHSMTALDILCNFSLSDTWFVKSKYEGNLDIVFAHSCSIIYGSCRCGEMFVFDWCIVVNLREWATSHGGYCRVDNHSECDGSPSRNMK